MKQDKVAIDSATRNFRSILPDLSFFVDVVKFHNHARITITLFRFLSLFPIFKDPSYDRPGSGTSENSASVRDGTIFSAMVFSRYLFSFASCIDNDGDFTKTWYIYIHMYKGFLRKAYIKTEKLPSTHSKIT